jgi:CDP-diacylglycerol--glycerol-3-phosphate 3-phosphatidyltransferase/cardiolipin synthase
MGAYQARHLLLAPNLISLVRLPLACAFPFVADRPPAALTVLAVAGVSDVLDGWLARTRGQVTATGAVVDGVTDKLFVAAVAVTLVVSGHLPWIGIVLLATRELGELPLVAWWALSSHGRRKRAEEQRANWLGKIATGFQVATVIAAIVGHPARDPLLGLTAIVGLVAGASYWRRALP